MYIVHLNIVESQDEKGTDQIKIFNITLKATIFKCYINKILVSINSIAQEHRNEVWFKCNRSSLASVHVVVEITDVYCL